MRNIQYIKYSWKGGLVEVVKKEVFIIPAPRYFTM